MPVAAAERKAVPGSRLVEEIIVTAQKREESLQSVPVSVSAFSGAALDARGIVEPTDLQRITPGLNISEQDGFTVAYLRGVGSDAYLLADPSVATYIDGIYFTFSHGLGQAFGDVKRVEIEKGPQGTLFGRNAIGGAINVITKDPESEPYTSVQTSYARFDQINTRVSTNIPLTDRLAFSISGLYNTEDNYYTGTVAGNPLPKEVEQAARLKIKWRPFENTDVVGAAYISHQQGERTMFNPNDRPFPLFALLIKPQTGYDNLSVDSPAYYAQNSNVFYGSVHSSFDWFDVKALGSVQHTNAPGELDFDGSPLPLITFAAPKLFIDAHSAELQLISNDSSWGNSWLKWIGGFYYFGSYQGFDPDVLDVANTEISSGMLLGVPILSGLSPALLTRVDNLLSSLPFPIPSGTIRLTGLLDTRSYAGYGQTTFSFTNWIGLTLGGRYQVETRTMAESSAALQNLNGGATQLFNYARQSATLYRFSPKISIEAHPFEDDTLAYLSWQEATKSGSYNVINIYEAPEYVKPETLRAWELGLKTRLFDGAVQLNGALFEYNDKNLQIQVVSLLNGGAVSFENANGGRIRGADLDSVIQILPSLIDGLVLTASGAYLDAVYTDYRNGSGYEPTTGLFEHAAFNFTGNDIVRTPRVSGNVGLSKTTALGSGSLELATDLYFTSHYFFASQQAPYSYQSPYHLLNAHAAYYYEPWKLRLTIFGENLTNATYSIGRFIDDFGVLDSLNRPVSAGVRLNWDF